MLRRRDLDALVFDLGGVVLGVDFDRAFAAWGAGAGVPAARLAERFAVDEAYRAHERGEIDDAAYFAALGERLGIELPAGQWLAGWNAVFTEPLPGIEALLERLGRLLPLYVLSNTNPAHVAHFRPRFAPLLARFRATVCSCEIGARKPGPEAFERMAKLVGAPPARLAFFDDREENVAGARLAGLRAYRVSSAAEVAHALGPDFAP